MRLAKAQRENEIAVLIIDGLGSSSYHPWMLKREKSAVFTLTCQIDDKSLITYIS